MKPPQVTYHFDAFRLDPARDAFTGPDGAIVLRPKTMALLALLAANPGRLMRREELLHALWQGLIVTDDSLTQCVSELRRALGDRAAAVLRTLPRRGYVLVADVTAEGDQPTEHDMLASRREQVLVEAFTHAAADPQAGHLAFALTAELVTRLATVEELTVLTGAAELGPDGCRIGGEVRTSGNVLRAAVRLEAGDGAAIWADRLRQPVTALPEPPEGVMDVLVTGIGRHIAQWRLQRARGKHRGLLTAAELCLLGKDYYHRGTEADTAEAAALFRAAIDADPNYALSHAWLSYVTQRAVTHGWGGLTADAARDLCLALAQRAVQLDPDSPLCIARLGFSLVMHRRWHEAQAAARAALRTGRHAAYDTRTSCGETLCSAGEPEEAVAELRIALVQDPLCPPATHAVLGRALLLAGRGDEALPLLRYCAIRLPDYAPCYHSLVTAGFELGLHAEMQAAWREARRLQPGWVPRNHTGHWFFRREEDAGRFLTAFRAAEAVDSSDG